MLNNRYYSIFIFIIFVLILFFFNYLKYFPINQVEFSNPDFSVTLDKINNFNEITNNPQSLFQYGPGYEYLYKILSFFNFTEIKHFYFITHLILPCISMFFLFMLFFFSNLKFSQFILIISILLTLEYFIYSSIRYMPIICLSILILNKQNYNKYLFFLFIYLYGFFFHVGIDYGLISFIALILALLLTKNLNFFYYKNFSIILYVLISILINHLLLTGSINILSTLNDLFTFSKFFDITDPSFSYQYPLFKFNILDIIYLIKSLNLKGVTFLLVKDFKTFFLYYFPFLQLLFVLFIIIRSFIKNKNFSFISKDLLFLSAFVFATQIRMLFGPGFIIYNYFQITLLMVVIINLSNNNISKILYYLFSCIFLFLFINITINKYYGHLEKSHITGVNYPYNYEGVYINKNLKDDLLRFHQFIDNSKISNALIYPWSFTTTAKKIKKINLIYDDRHLISTSEKQNELFEKIIKQTDKHPYLILDLNYSLGIAFFNDSEDFLTNIKDQYSNFSNNSIVFNGEENKLRKFIAQNYEYMQSFGKIHIFKKGKFKEIPINISNINFDKNHNQSKYVVSLEKDIVANFIDIEFEISQSNFFKKFFGQSYFDIIFFDDQNDIISETRRPLSRSHYNKNIKMRFFIDNLNKSNYLNKFEIKFEKIKKFNFINEKFKILNLEYGTIDFNSQDTTQ